MRARAASGPRIPIFFLLLLLVPALGWGAPLAPALPPGLADGGNAVVAEVIDGDSLVLADGRTVRLVGIQAPKLPKGRSFAPWPLAREAKAALAELSLGKSVSLHYGGAREDRYGRVLAQLERADGLWLEGELLRRGLARVYTFSDNRMAAARLYALERQARKARRGIWADPRYAPRKPEEALRHVGGFELVEGRIVSAAHVSGSVFLNFGEDWRTAFTIRLDAKALRLFRAEGIDPASLEGERVRVRGYLRRDRARAVIDVTHPEAIERL
jgi:endonuclease YncB( thermonuclease family)